MPVVGGWPLVREHDTVVERLPGVGTAPKSNRGDKKDGEFLECVHLSLVGSGERTSIKAVRRALGNPLHAGGGRLRLKPIALALLVVPQFVLLLLSGCLVAFDEIFECLGVITLVEGAESGVAGLGHP